MMHETLESVDQLSALPPNGRVLALDLGGRRVGVAVCDELRLTVRALPVLQRTSPRELLRSIQLLCAEFDLRGIVVGLPLNMDGSHGEPAANAARFARNLKLSLDIPVFLQDERLTSRAAEAELRNEGFSLKERRKRIDGAAASIILSDFLSRVEGAAEHVGEGNFDSTLTED